MSFSRTRTVQKRQTSQFSAVTKKEGFLENLSACLVKGAAKAGVTPAVGIVPKVAIKTSRSVLTASSASYTETYQSSQETKAVRVAELYVALADYFPEKDDTEGIPLAAGQLVELLDPPSSAKRPRLDPSIQPGEDFPSVTSPSLLDSSAAKHKLAIRPKRKHVDPRQKGGAGGKENEGERCYVRSRATDTLPQMEGWAPITLLERMEERKASTTVKTTQARKMSRQTQEEDTHVKTVHTRKVSRQTPEEEAQAKREAVLKEMVETEEEFGKDLKYVHDNYLKQMENPTMPRHLRDHKAVIFLNFKQIYEFHTMAMLEGVKYYANEPRMFGRFFLRLERDFDKHVAYCRDEPLAQEFLQSNIPVRSYFEEFSQRIGDDKTLPEHLKLPIQRINDYQLLLRELVKYSARLKENTDDLQKALDLMLGIPQRATDIKFINSIEGFRGSIHKLGRLLRHDWFTVRDNRQHCKDRYLFLFKARILVTKVKRISQDRSIFLLKDIIRLPDVVLNPDTGNPRSFELVHKDPTFTRYPLTLEAQADGVKESWLKEIREYASNIVALSEHADDDLQIEGLGDADLGDEEGRPDITSPEPEIEEEEPKPQNSVNSKPQVPKESQVKGFSEQVSKTPKRKESEEKQKEELQVQKKTKVEETKLAESVKSKDKPKSVETERQKEETKPVKPKEEHKPVEPGKPKEETKPVKPKEEHKPVEPGKPKEETKPVKPKEEVKPVESEKPKEEPELVKPKEEPKLVKPKEEVKPVEPEKPKEEPKPVKPKEELTPVEPEKPKEKPKPVKPKEEPRSAELLKTKEEPKPEVIAKHREEPKPVKPTEPVKQVEEPKPVKPKQDYKQVTPVKPQDVSKPVEPIQPKEEPKPVQPLKPKEEPKLAVPEKSKEEPKPVEPVKAKEELKPAIPVKPKEEHKPVEPVKQKQEPKTAVPVKPEEAKSVEPIKPKQEPKTAVPVKLEEAKPVEPVKPKEEPKPIKPKEEHKPVKPKEEPKPVEPVKPKEEPKPAVPVTPKEKPKLAEPGKPKEEPKQVKPKEEPKPAEPIKPKEEPKPVKSKTELKAEEPVKVKEEPKSVELVKPKEKPKPAVQVKAKEEPKPVKPKEESKLVEPVKPKEEPKPVELVKAREEPKTVQPLKQKGSKPLEPVKPEKEIKPEQQQVKSKEEVKPSETTKEKQQATPEEAVKTKSRVAEKQVSEDLETYEEMDNAAAESVRSSSLASVEDYQSLASARSEDFCSVMGTPPGGTPTPTPSAAPSFVKTIHGSFVEPGEKCTFECVLDAPGSVSWLRDNRPLDDKLADRVQCSAKGSCFNLVMLNCRTDDSGLYTARAVNEAGTNSCSAQLMVADMTPEEKKQRAEANSPFFLVQLTDCEILQDSSVRFMLKTVGQPNPTVTFFKDNVPLQEDERLKVNREHAATGSYEIVVTSVRQEDAGIYSCVAKNRFGEASCQGNVVITDEKRVFAFLEGKHLLQPGETPVFTWFRDGSEFDPQERFKVLLKDDEDTLALVFQHVKPEDAGLYTCVASTSSGRISCSAELTVQGAINQLLKEPEPPQILLELVDTEVSQGGSAMLEVKVTGYPKPTVTWHRDEQEVKAGGRFKFLYEDEESIALIIKGVTEEDTGKYTVEARNDLGAVISQGQLSVKAPPKFKKKMVDMACMTDQPFKMEVEVEGSPTPEIKWYKDGQLLIESERVKFVKESAECYTIVFERVVIEDSGSYSVVASNSMGQMSEFWGLTANSPPKFIKEMTMVESDEGKSATFQVKVQGNPTPGIKWLKEGKEIKIDMSRIVSSEDGNTYTLKINKVTKKDDAMYTCEVSNDHGTTQSLAKLNIRRKPSFTGQLQDVEAKEGEECVSLTVVVDAYPPPKIKWFLDKVEITEKRTEFSKIEEKESYSLMIKEVKTELSGTYTCEVTNDLGSAKSSAVLSVCAQPEFDVGLEDIEVVEGKKVKFTVKCKGVPAPEVKWFKDGVEMSADATVKIKKENTETWSLSLDLVIGGHAGQYEARAKNWLGEVNTTSKLTVNTKTTIMSTTLEDCETYEEEDLAFQVVATGCPKPVAVWLKGPDKQPLTESDHIQIIETDDGVYRLQLKHCVMDDAGVYTCELSNKLGKDSRQGVLTVKSAEELKVPKVLVKLSDCTVSKDQQATFTAKIRGNPKPTVTWYKDSVELSESDNVKLSSNDAEYMYTLTIPTTKEADAGAYAVMATNENGEEISTAELTVLMKPEIEGLNNAECWHGETVKFEVIIRANPKAKVTWSKKGHELKSNEHISIILDKKKGAYCLMINSVTLEDASDYIISASNSQGETTTHVNFTVKTEPPTFTKELADVQAQAGETVTFEATIAGIPQPTLTWLRSFVTENVTKTEELKSSDRIKITQSEDQLTHTLVIEKIVKEDLGKFIAKAVSPAGETESSAELCHQMAAPELGEGLEPATSISEGTRLELKAMVNGSPQPKITWYKNGKEVVPDDHVKMTVAPDGTVTLVIEHAKPEDAGEYKMVAVNKLGETSSACAVDVKPKPKKPKFSKKLEDVLVEVGKPLKLQAKITGYPKPEIKWMREGKQVHPSQCVIIKESPDGICTLEIMKSQTQDVGKYTVVVKNSEGECKSNANVEVDAPPVAPLFITPLKNVKAVEGSPVKLEAAVTGHPTPIIIWMKGEKMILADDKNVEYTEQPDSDGVISLLIKKSRVKDTADYAAVAANSEAEVRSEAKVTIQGKQRKGEPEVAPSFSEPLQNSSVDEGSTLRLSATILGNPIPDARWTKDGQPIPANEVTLFNDGEKVGLQISGANPKDSGKYECHLTSPQGTASCAADVIVEKVYYPPKFIQTFSDLQQVRSYDSKFMCQVKGNPAPSICWEFNGNTIYEGDKYKIKADGDVHCLFVHDCKESDAGKYSCAARNIEGIATCEANLEIVEKIEKKEKSEAPSFLKKISNCEVYEGMAAKFTACTAGQPAPQCEWFKDGSLLLPSDRIQLEQEGAGLLRLTINNVQQMDHGTYRLRIFNPHGEAFCEARLTYDALDTRSKRPVGDQYIGFDKFRQGGVPLPLSHKPIISRMTDRRLTLSWKPSIPIGARVPVTYQVEMCECPDGKWFSVKAGIRSCACDIRNLEPFRDYKFRVRVENKYGVSDPSPHAMTLREQLLPGPPKFYQYLEPGIAFRPETSPYFPKDFDIDRPPHEGYAQAPRFLRQEHDSQYGVKNQNCNLMWFLYGYPTPKISYTFNDEPIEMGGRYDNSYTRNGQATLFINKMLDRDMGIYEAIASNEHGEARQRVKLAIAEYPKFITRPEETIVMARKSCRVECRVEGVPYPDIKWHKDWQPLAPSTRTKIHWSEPDTCILSLEDTIFKDAGLYSITASNVAGSISASFNIHIEDNEEDYEYLTYTKPRNVKPKTKLFDDLYDIGDELGRGTAGVTYHAVERRNGRSFAAKVMHGSGMLKPFMYNEIEMMNLLTNRHLIRLYDAFETSRSLTLVTELASGGELIDVITRQTTITESEIAAYIRQILWGLEHMHAHNTAHLGLTPGDILFSRPNGDEIKICDFALSRRIVKDKLATLDYGMPEFVSPEVANGEGVGLSADMWSVGVITYLLLSGISPFRGENDRDTLRRVQTGQLDFDMEIFSSISDDAKDFLSKLLVFQSSGRMDVHGALRHPWLKMADAPAKDMYSISTDRLKNYYIRFRDWYSNASCRTWYRRRPLSGAFTHPSCMVYPPGEVYTPAETPERSLSRLDYDIGNFKSDSHYQYGPDTYLLQVRDTDYPCRIREYMKVASRRSHSFKLKLEDTPYEFSMPIIRERRRFMDIMDEEIDEERKYRINRYGSGEIYTPRRLKRETGTRSDTHAEAEAILESKREGQLPFFREKPHTRALVNNKPLMLTCLAVGDPMPSVQWFQNNVPLGGNSRLKILEDEEKRSILSFEPAMIYDAGVYKAVARNKIGSTIAKVRLVCGDVPSAPDSPEVAEISDTEVLLKWKLPVSDGNSPILCYTVQYEESASTEWVDVASNIDHEFFLVHNLKPDTLYQFRVCAMNKIGWGEKSVPSEPIFTKNAGCQKVTVTRTMKYLQQLTESGHVIDLEETKPEINYHVEKEPIEMVDGLPTEKYRFIAEIARGRFSMITKCVRKQDDKIFAAKLLERTAETEDSCHAEFEYLRSVRHEQVCALYEAYRMDNMYVFIMEKLQGSDILTYLSSKHEYSEEMVATAITQVLDGLQYLHWRGWCHLDLQPDNVVLTSLHTIQVKLTDLASAQPVSKLGTKVEKVGSLEYTAPEVLKEEPAYPQSDVWSVGVLAYLLLSGVSPFRGASPEETRQNILYVRYRFEHLYKEITTEATRFLMLIFKQSPVKRPTVMECLDNRWLIPSEYVLRKRERAVFLGGRLKEFSDAYHMEREKSATKSESLMNAFGMSFSRSISLQHDIYTTF